MKLRVLRRNVYVSSSSQKGWGAKSIERTRDVLQMWEDKEGWVDVPVTVDTLNVFKDSLDVSNY